ncbi:hypothetical protein BpHYR1_019006 [Brachionus plicatilis]|uniref:Uncharacterized protein n=1 Tax=Brachionus plicatilis TaxID=10195 RepID=A0A3M7RPC4_BRAPC|nr:hypothetical protein BpHYR1_019006 [Brachionus plicatilis]
MVYKWHQTNPFRESWNEPKSNEALEENMFLPNYRRRDVYLDTPINPFRNSEMFEGSEEGAYQYTQQGGEQKSIAVQTT